MNIEAGYQLQITSWTNDADNYNTTIHSGLSKADVEFLIAVVKPFESVNRKGSFGNNDSCTEAVNEHILECFKNHKDLTNSKYAEWVEGFAQGRRFDGLSDLAYDLVGYDEYCGWRVFDGFKVFFFPEAVEEVTKEFK